MKKISILLFGFILLLNSCSPKISTNIKKNYSAIDFREEVKIFGINDALPPNSEVLGVVKIGDTGFSTNCGWDVVIDKARIEARKIGGNAIKITEHTPPSTFGSSCDRITAQILKIDNLENFEANQVVDSTLLNADFALLHIYRSGGTGSLVSYDLHLGDSVICNVQNKWKKTFKIKKDGLNTIWAKTESKVEIPINIKFGQEYYLRCSVSMGAIVGRPKLEIVDNQVGKAEYQSTIKKESLKRDHIVMNDNREVECIINSEDAENVYITMFVNKNKIKTQISKSQIKTIEKSE